MDNQSFGCSMAHTLSNEKWSGIVFYAFYSMHCIQCIAFNALHSMHCILCIVFHALYLINCIICIVFYALHSLHCILCIVFNASYSMHCIQCIVFNGLHYISYSSETSFRYSIYILLLERAIILFFIIYNIYIVVIYLEFAPF
jgi:hypothetical protein